MVGRRRNYSPNSANKVALNVYNIAAARAGVYATESPVLQMAIYEYAKNAAFKWNEIGAWASTLYNQIVSRYDLKAYQKAAVRALIGAASKYVQVTKKGAQINRDKVVEELSAIKTDLGVDVPPEIIEVIAHAATAQ